MTNRKKSSAVVRAIQTLRTYFQVSHITVHTDRVSFWWLSAVRERSGKLLRWRVVLEEFDFDFDVH